MKILQKRKTKFYKKEKQNFEKVIQIDHDFLPVSLRSTSQSHFVCGSQQWVGLK